jgi:polyhydroxybutyrate depolymerase
VMRARARPGPGPGPRLGFGFGLAFGVACALLIASCTPLRSGDATRGGGLAPGVHDLTLEHDGRLRRARVFIPGQPAPGDGYPVVLAFHGGGGRADSFAQSSGFEALASREGFIAVHPDGTGPAGVHTWNAGAYCCGTARDQAVDDVGFVVALVALLEAQAPVNRGRIYGTGHSNGAMIVYRIAEETRGSLFAAIAPVGGARLPDTPEALVPTPLLHLHSADDPRALYDGGGGPAFPLTNHRVEHPSVPEMLAAWRQANGCGVSGAGLSPGAAAMPGAADAPTVLEVREGRAGLQRLPQRAELLSWEPCTSGAPVFHWRFEGVGHGWPGTRAPLLRQELIGPGTTLVNAAEAVWDFVQRFTLENRRS